MKRSQRRSQPEWKAGLAKTKRRIDEFGSIRVGEAYSISGLEDKGVIVGQVEVVETPEPDQAPPVKSEDEEEVEGTREVEVSSEESDTMP